MLPGALAGTYYAADYPPYMGGIDRVMRAWPQNIEVPPAQQCAFAELAASADGSTLQHDGLSFIFLDAFYACPKTQFEFPSPIDHLAPCSGIHRKRVIGPNSMDVVCEVLLY